jgi:nucleoside-diphosphate-sugar epimerase
MRIFLLLALLLAHEAMGVALTPGDSVCVFGASGNVGKLVALRLSERYKVRGVVRSTEKARAFLGDKVTLFEADLNDLPKARDEKLRDALDGVNAVVICTGTTAFPTKAWSQDGTASVTEPVLRALAEAKFSVPGAISRLDAEGLNTPRNIDELGTQAILQAWAEAAGPQRKMLTMMSSIGVQRRDQMPFPILNACGVLDAKAVAEAAVAADAAAGGYAHTIVRPGQLFGGPYDNNVYLGTLFQLDKENPQDVQLAAGDTLVGDTLRSTLAEVIAQCLEADIAAQDCSVVNVDGMPPDVEALRERLVALR